MGAASGQRRMERVARFGPARPAGPMQVPGPFDSYEAAFRRALDWDKILAAAEPIFSSAQLEALRGMAAQARVDGLLAAAKQEAAGQKK